MNPQHAQEILVVLAEWYQQNAEGPNGGALLFDDDRTLEVHITAALGGMD